MSWYENWAAVAFVIYLYIMLDLGVVRIPWYFFYGKNAVINGLFISLRLVSDIIAFSLGWLLAEAIFVHFFGLGGVVVYVNGIVCGITTVFCCEASIYYLDDDF